jgi:DUF4097 and DUF4098 domain-containing protein YvlB
MTMRRSLTYAPAHRRRGSPILPALLAFLAVLASAGNVRAGSTTLQEEETRTLKVERESKISVKNARGKTIVVGRKDARGVEIRFARFVRAGDAETARRWMDQLTYTVETDGEEISIVLNQPDKTVDPGSFWSFLSRIKDRAYIDCTVEVPASFDAKVSATSGDVQITSIEGNVDVAGSSGDALLRTIGGAVAAELSSGDVDADGVGGDFSLVMSSGDAFVRKVGGSASVRGTSGDVELYDIAGAATAELSSGDLLVEGCRGAVTARTHSGDIRVADAAGAVNVSATSGDIEAGVAFDGPTEHSIKSSSGSVTVSFPAKRSAGFVLEVNTNTGSIEGNLEIKLDVISRKALKGVVGAGEGRLHIETASGDIRINEVGN